MYAPSPLPQEIEELPAYVGRELEQLSNVLQVLTVPFVQFQVHYAAPGKPRQGQAYYADGTSWSPGGGGEGLYVYTAAGWAKL